MKPALKDIALLTTLVVWTLLLSLGGIITLPHTKYLVPSLHKIYTYVPFLFTKFTMHYGMFSPMTKTDGWMKPYHQEIQIWGKCKGNLIQLPTTDFLVNPLDPWCNLAYPKTKGWAFPTSLKKLRVNTTHVLGEEIMERQNKLHPNKQITEVYLKYITWPVGKTSKWERENEKKERDVLIWK